MENSVRFHTDQIKHELHDLVCDKIQAHGEDHAEYIVAALMEVSAEVGVSFFGELDTIQKLEVTSFAVAANFPKSVQN